jgi:hypothetical protein
MASRILGWFGIRGGKVLAGERTSDATPILGVTLFGGGGGGANAAGGAGSGGFLEFAEPV